MIMKKLIAISVVFALVVGAAFAEISFGGTVFGKVDVVKGESGKDAYDEAKPIGVGGGMGRVDASANAESEDGSFGGFLRFRAGGYGDGAQGWGAAWWKPIDQVKFQIGNNPDGIFDTTHMTRWGFYQVAGDVGVVAENHAWSGFPVWGTYLLFSDYVFYGGTGDFGAYLTISPADLLTFNIGLPYADGPAADVYKKILLQAVVNLDSIGQFNLTYQADKGYKEGKPGTGGTADVTYYEVFDKTSGTISWLPAPPAPGDDTKVVLRTQKGAPGTPAKGYIEGYNESPGKIFASFYLSMIEDLGIDLGFSFTLPGKTADGKETRKDIDPLGIGLGIQYGAGQFGIKARVLTALGGKYYTTGTDTEDMPIALAFDVLPSFAINDNLTAFLSDGIELYDKDKDAKDPEQAVVNFHINPYVQYAFDWSKGLFVGFRLASAGTDNKNVDATMSWSVPIGLYFAF